LAAVIEGHAGETPALPGDSWSGVLTPSIRMSLDALKAIR